MADYQQVFVFTAKASSDDMDALNGFNDYVVSSYPMEYSIQDCRVEPYDYRFLTVIPDEMKEYFGNAADSYSVSVQTDAIEMPRDEYLKEKGAH